ncbi:MULTISPECIES: S8 family serine peptidase [Halolamina]|uniref:Serine protease, subtilisin family n=2 Tax=Halolamina TaxID=1075397 RepID=A0A1I5VU07_9EURY|nr:MULTISPECIES: S8 family serine peptidase [Halolamina]NHX37857.1 S8 family serine peptidase [Halolamina sp. R1-12]SFQ10767.1 Serine protease, subtilisin family [Halolamina pelagica]
MLLNRSLLLSVFLIGLLVFSLVASPVVGASFASNFSQSPHTDSDVEISVSSDSGETLDLLIYLEDLPSSTNITTRKHQAAHAQSALLKFANHTQGLTVKNRFWISNAVLVTVDTERVSLESISHVEGVERIQSNVEVTANNVSAFSDTNSSSSSSVVSPVTESSVASSSSVTSNNTTYGLSLIGAPTVWETYDTQGDGIRVAVLDSGVDVSHPALSLYSSDPDDPTYPGGWAEFDENGTQVTGSRPSDAFGHGTHVSGTVAGGSANGTHIGVAPNVSLMHGQILGPDGTGTLAQALAGIEWAVENDADVIGMSVGVETYESEFIDPIRVAREHGTVVVASIGNYGAGSSESPGNVYDVYSVGAVDANASVAEFSSGESINTTTAWGTTAPPEWPASYVVPSVTAPGVNVVSIGSDGSLTSRSGTSMAVPHVVGAMALLQAATPVDHSPSNLTEALTETARKPDSWPVADGKRDTRYGAGIIDIPAAITYLTEPSATPEFEVRSTALNTTSVLEGDRVAVTAEIENTGTSEGTYTAGLRVNGTVVATDSVRVPANETASLTMTHRFDQRGDYQLAVNDTLVGTLRVDRPAQVSVRNVSLTSDRISANESANVSVTLENTGDRSGSQSVALLANETVVSTRTVDVPPRDTVQTTLSSRFSDVGHYILAVNNVTAGELTVTRPANLTLTEATLETTRVSPDQSVNVSVTVSNTGGTTGMYTADLEWGDITLTTTQLSVPAGATNSTILQISFARDGTYDLAVNGVNVGEVTVTDTAAWATPYVTADGRVDASGLNTAIKDYLQGELSAPRLNTVIRAYLSGQPVLE